MKTILKWAFWCWVIVVIMIFYFRVVDQTNPDLVYEAGQSMQVSLWVIAGLLKAIFKTFFG